MLLELVVDVFLAAGDLLESARDVVVQLVELTLRVLEIRVDVVVVLVHLVDVHAPVLRANKQRALSLRIEGDLRTISRAD